MHKWHTGLRARRLPGGDAFILQHLQPVAEVARRLSQRELGARTGIVPLPGKPGEVARAFD